MKRAIRGVLTVVLSPIWGACFVIAMVAGGVFVLMFAISSLCWQPRFMEEWAEHLFG